MCVVDVCVCTYVCERACSEGVLYMDDLYYAMDVYILTGLYMLEDVYNVILHGLDTCLIYIPIYNIIYKVR